MAPKQPSRPGAPRKSISPGMSSKLSSNHGIHKTPTPILSPKPLSPENIRKSRVLVEELARSNTQTLVARSNPTRYEGQHSEHSDEHTSLQVDLSILGGQLDEIVNESHTELQSRISSAQHSQKLAELSQHLLDSPPSSPESLHSRDSLPKSPTAKIKRAEFQRQELEELIRQDAEFHRLMSDLIGIREWWKGNKQAWHEKRDEVNVIENNIAALYAQLEQHRPRGWGANVRTATQSGKADNFSDDRWTPQIQALQAQMAGLMPWFDENRKLMKMVWVRVKEIDAAVKPEARVSKRPGPYISRYQSTNDITTLSWYLQEDRGMRWWLRIAIKDFGTFESEFQDLLKSDLGRADQRHRIARSYEQVLDGIQADIVKDDTEADEQISALQNQKPEDYEASINQILNTRRKAKILQKRQEFDMQEMLKGMKMRDNESTIIQKSLTDYINRNRECASLLREIARNPPKIQPHGHQFEDFFYTDLYNLIYTHIARCRQGLSLNKRMDKITFSQTKRDKIIELMDINSYGHNTERFFHDLNARLTPTAHSEGRIDHVSLHSALVESEEEACDHHIMTEACTAILYQKEPAFRASVVDIDRHPANYMVPDIRHITLAKQPPDNTLDMSRTIGTAMTLAIAKQILEEYPETTPGQITNNIVPWYELLRDFYTAPDIFPLFRNTSKISRSWTKDHFFAYTNTLVRTPINRNILEAFLVFCSHTSDLFHTEFTRRVETIPNGWSLAVETPIKGIYRKVSPANLIPPRGIDRAEHMLIKHRVGPLDNELQREWTEEQVLDFLNKLLPYGQRVDREQIRKYISYWSSTGQFFVLENPPKLIRVDNGFHIPLSCPYAPIPSHPQSYSSIRDHVVAANQRRPFVDRLRDKGGISERKLYRCVFLKVREKGMNWEVSRFQFHLFLRWCTQRREMCWLGRDGGIEVLEKGW